MGPIWGQQDPGGPHVGPMNFALWDMIIHIREHISWMNALWLKQNAVILQMTFSLLTGYLDILNEISLFLQAQKSTIQHWFRQWLGTEHRSFDLNQWHHMMTSLNGDIFHVTGPLCGEFSGHQWIPLTRPVTWSFDISFDLCLYKLPSKQSRRLWFYKPSCSLWRRHCNGNMTGLANTLSPEIWRQLNCLSYFHVFISISGSILFIYIYLSRMQKIPLSCHVKFHEGN